MESIEVMIEDGVGYIYLARPQVYNAINSVMMDELEITFDKWKNDSQVKVIVISGKGDNFSSGGDLAEFHALNTKEAVMPMLLKMANILNKLENIGKPTIAVLTGKTLGGGAELAVACDIRIASIKANLGFIQINLGITAGWGSGIRLIRKIGRSKGLYVLLTGKLFDSNQLKEIGLVDLVVEDELLTDTVKNIATLISSHDQKAIDAYLTLANELKNSDSSFYDLQRKEIERSATLWESPIHVEAVNNFLRKK